MREGLLAELKVELAAETSELRDRVEVLEQNGGGPCETHLVPEQIQANQRGRQTRKGAAVAGGGKADEGVPAGGEDVEEEAAPAAVEGGGEMDPEHVAPATKIQAIQRGRQSRKGAAGGGKAEQGEPPAAVEPAAAPATAEVAAEQVAPRSSDGVFGLLMAALGMQVRGTKEMACLGRVRQGQIISLVPLVEVAFVSADTGARDQRDGMQGVDMARSFL